jgi:hypothetical protein
MKTIITFFALVSLAGCSSHKQPPPLLPKGNMPMTEREYEESERLLLEQQGSPPAQRETGEDWRTKRDTEDRK